MSGHCTGAQKHLFPSAVRCTAIAKDPPSTLKAFQTEAVRFIFDMETSLSPRNQPSWSFVSGVTLYAEAREMRGLLQFHQAP